MRKTFLQKLCRKSCTETRSKPPFSKRKKRLDDIFIDLDLDTHHHSKTNCIIFQIVDPEPMLILIFCKGSGTSFFTIFVHDFLRRMFPMLYSTNWTNFTAWLTLFLEILSNVFNINICYTVCDVINSEANLSFLIKPFFYMTTKVKTKT